MRRCGVYPVAKEKIESGGAIRVGYPRDIEVLCAGAYFYPVALSGEVTCVNVLAEAYFELRLSRPLPPGQTAFTVTSTCPAAVNDNYFYIVVMTGAGQVSDAAMSIPGLRIQHGLPVSAMPEIIIEMPPDFSHQVQKTAQLETLTNALPRREGGWLDVTNPRRLRLLMDETAIQKLAIADYRFQWPIMVPAVMPKYNAGSLAFVEER
eukprot:g29380.t1